MRKILFTLLLLCGVTLVGYSQTNIDNLQNKYNFLSCEFRLYKVQNDLSVMDKDIQIKCNDIDIKRYHKLYYEPFYDVLEDTYKSYIYLKSAIEDNYKSLKEYVYALYHNFNIEEKNVIDTNFTTINATINKVDQSLKLYRMTLDLYKNKE